MVFHWSLSDSKSPQVSTTLLSILGVLNNVVVWMVSTHPPNSKSPSPISNPLVTVPNASVTIAIIVSACAIIFSIPKQGRATYPSFHFLSFWQTVYSCKTELFEIEQTICRKMDLALDNRQRFICHKTQPTNQLGLQASSDCTRLSKKKYLVRIVTIIVLTSNDLIIFFPEFRYRHKYINNT